MSLPVNDSVVACLGSIYGLLVIATLVIFWSPRLGDRGELLARMRTWWIIVSLFALAVLTGQWGVILFFAGVSCLALKEFLAIIPTLARDRSDHSWLYAALVLQYYWVLQAWFEMFVLFIPLGMVLLVPGQFLLQGEARNFHIKVAVLGWGLIMLVFGISHTAFLGALALNGNPSGGVGLVLFLVFLTQINDVAQYCWGKLLGAHKMTPKISPNKTWEGFIGGMLTTTGLAVALAGWLTPMPPLAAVASGLLISGAGCFGDLTFSALKRDLGIKDFGTTLPGHGGVLDRVDSLTYAAPAFFHFIRFVYY